MAAIHFPHNHYLYVIARRDDDEWVSPAKVGITSNLRGRLNSIQTSCPFRLEIVEAIAFPTKQMAQDVETATHRKLAAFRVMGEWFNIEPTAAYRASAALVRAMLAKQTDDEDDLDNTFTLMCNVEFEGINP